MKFKKVVDSTEIEIDANWYESNHHIYRRFKVFVNGRKSNRKIFEKYGFAELPNAWTANTYFWSSGKPSRCRRDNERKRMQEIKDWATRNGFQVDG